jgi:hypothetical protein
MPSHLHFTNGDGAGGSLKAPGLGDVGDPMRGFDYRLGGVPFANGVARRRWGAGRLVPSAEM